MTDSRNVKALAEKAGFDLCRGDGWPDTALIEKLHRFASALQSAQAAQQSAQGSKTVQIFKGQSVGKSEVFPLLLAAQEIYPSKQGLDAQDMEDSGNYRNLLHARVQIAQGNDKDGFYKAIVDSFEKKVADAAAQAKQEVQP